MSKPFASNGRGAVGNFYSAAKTTRCPINKNNAPASHWTQGRCSCLIRLLVFAILDFAYLIPHLGRLFIRFLSNKPIQMDLELI
ncbi:MAG: hypothetical protein ACI8PG_005209 [Planctomycetota bacterium]|jgi:hypothetical protein